MKRITFLIALLFAASTCLLAQQQMNSSKAAGIDLDSLRAQRRLRAENTIPSYTFAGKPTKGNDNQLWLHGYRGMYITSGSEPDLDIVAYYARTQNSFVFRSDVAAQSFYTLSDARLRASVKPLDGSLSRLRLVSGVSYTLSYDALKNANRIKSKGAELSAEKAATAAELQLEARRKKECELQRVGFAAQDLQKVFPELVRTDPSGSLYVDNIGLIPVIVEALKEQQGQIEQQQQQIDEQKMLIENLMKLLGEARQVMVTKK